MEIRTFRAKSMQEALWMVRRELGPDAAVLHTRELGKPMLRWLSGGRQIEVTASVGVRVPSRLSQPVETRTQTSPPTPPLPSKIVSSPHKVSQDEAMRRQLDELAARVEQLTRTGSTTQRDMPDALFELFAGLIESDVDEQLARELVERVRREVPVEDLADSLLVKSRVGRMIEAELSTSGPIEVPAGGRRIVALVGPTGVGKTTTIAKLAANFRLREKRRVGLITVDTYRIAAVEQLRTYADIIDLPMEVVSTPRQMQAAVERLADLELVLMDTAGRSPRDEVKIQELKSMLADAGADEIHLVLSSTASAASLVQSARRFAEVGTTALIVTKLDEVSGLGNLLPLCRAAKLPLSYVTNGQNVPDDIQPANARKLARSLLGMETGR